MIYRSTPIPEDAPRGLRAWLADQLRQIADTLSQPTVLVITLTELHAEPDRYQDGDCVFADGTDWNPGAGEGIYARYNSTWNKL